MLDNIGVDTGTARTEVRELLGAEPELAPRTRYSVLSGPARPRKEDARLLEMLRNLEERVRELEAERAGRDGEFWKAFGN